VSTVTELLAGRYQVLERLGAGGMGAVYRAHDHLLDRVVAVKVPAVEATARSRERFRREARSAARLNHANVVRVYDWEERAGEAFLVLEYVEGPSLRDVLATRGPLPAAEAARIGEQIADALAHAHGQGVVHRDVKPANVLVLPDGTVKVTDFGIARTPDSDTLTEPGAVIGTVGYLAPEQLRGAPADARSDVYALGMVLATVTGGARGALDPVIARATAADPADRFQSAAGLRDVLGAVARDAPIAGVPVVVEEPPVGLAPTAHPSGPSRPPSPPTPGPSQPARAVGSRPAAPEPARTRTRERRPRRRVWRARHVFALALAPLVVAGAAVSYVALVRRPAAVTVPEVVNHDALDAVATLRAAKLAVAQRFVDDPTPGGVVLGQRPPSGARAEEGSSVVITVSRSQAVVPMVTGLSREDAQGRLADAGFVTVNVTEEDRDDEDPGTVLRSSPVAGVRADKTAPVALVVARDPYVRVPVNVTGADATTVTAALQGLGLVVRRETLTSRSVPANVVVSVSPGSGQTVRRGSTVTLRVSLGPRQLAVPSTVGQHREDAVQQLEDAGFSVVVTAAPGSSGPRDRVVSQSPPGGSAAEGSTVTIAVALSGNGSGKS
jgi:serine/threonine-protein kinase